MQENGLGSLVSPRGQKYQALAGLWAKAQMADDACQAAERIKEMELEMAATQEQQFAAYVETLVRCTKHIADVQKCGLHLLT
jgi:hypothetical protein